MGADAYNNGENKYETVYKEHVYGRINQLVEEENGDFHVWTVDEEQITCIYVEDTVNGFKVKEITEEEGPTSTDCPVDFLGICSKVANQEWRDKVISESGELDIMNIGTLNIGTMNVGTLNAGTLNTCK